MSQSWDNVANMYEHLHSIISLAARQDCPLEYSAHVQMDAAQTWNLFIA